MIVSNPSTIKSVKKCASERQKLTAPIMCGSDKDHRFFATPETLHLRFIFM